jgi:hypothetical protein
MPLSPKSVLPVPVKLPLSLQQPSAEVPPLDEVDEVRKRHDPLTSLLSACPRVNRLGMSGSLPAALTGLFRDIQSILQPILL